MHEPIEFRADHFFRQTQARICAALEEEDGVGRFSEDAWERPGGGGGLTRCLAGGAVFEKGGVNHSAVHGEFPPDFAEKLPGEGLAFFAAGVSLVLHPQNPYVPAVHANFRVLRRGSALWFGGGADLTPYYPELEDVLHFHRTWRTVCDAHKPDYYARFKKWCDEYFFLPHRNETRGVGGLFFDYLQGEPEHDFAFVQDCADHFLDAYLPIVQRRRHTPFGERERDFQLLRRGRYVEFNLIFDRGTTFGLRTHGRTESILMSMPPLVRWEYEARFPLGSREAQLAEWLRPTDWLATSE